MKMFSQFIIECQAMLENHGDGPVITYPCQGTAEPSEVVHYPNYPTSGSGDLYDGDRVYEIKASEQTAYDRWVATKNPPDTSIDAWYAYLDLIEDQAMAAGNPNPTEE